MSFITFGLLLSVGKPIISPPRSTFGVRCFEQFHKTRSLKHVGGRVATVSYGIFHLKSTYLPQQ